MAKTYRLAIVTPKGKIFDADVEFLSAPGQEGSFGVLPGHAPMLNLLRPGVLKVRGEGQERFFAVSRGVLEINPERRVMILADKAVPCASEDAAKREQASKN